MGRTAHGIRGIRFQKKMKWWGWSWLLLTLRSWRSRQIGYGKRTQASEYRFRIGEGPAFLPSREPKKTGDVIGIKTVLEEDELMHISNKGKIIRLRAVDIPVQGRSTPRVRLITLEEGERVCCRKAAEKE